MTREPTSFSRNPAKTVSKAEQISTEMAQRIVDGQLLPGSLLASENELSSVYGVSRPHVRQALQRLAAAGLIETRHGLGSYVNPKELWNLFDPMLLNAFMQSNNLVAIADELIELRKMVELECCRLAATKISEAELTELSRWLERMDATLDNTEAIAQADILFHDVIVSASRNRFLQGIMTYLHDCLSQARLLTMETVKREDRTIIQRQHRAIYEAIEKRNPEEAQNAMRIHMRQHEKDLKNALLSINLSAP